MEKQKISNPIEMLNEIWQFIHDHLNDDLKRNKKESAKSLGEIASFIRKTASPDLLKQFNTKEYLK